MHAPPKSSYPVAEPTDLLQYDAVLFGIPTRYGNFPAQWKAFWDKTGSIWFTGGFWGKYAGVFISTGTMGGGQESTALASMSTLAHHGFVFVPLGYKTTFPLLSNLDEVHGGSPWGAGTFAVSILNECKLYTALTSHIGCRWFSPANRSRASDRRSSGQGFLRNRRQGSPLTAWRSRVEA